MLWNASAINGYTIETEDGSLGSVSDLLFDDVDWVVRWLVVDTGNWLPGRKVLLPRSALGRPDRTLRQFPVQLKMQQVKDSPEIHTDQPVSRQTETDTYENYGLDPYWDDNFSAIKSEATTLLSGTFPLSRSKAPDAGSVDAPHKVGNPHLRSMTAVTGSHIDATDGEIGHVEEFFVDDATWSIRYVIVDTTNWWPGAKVLISPYLIREIDSTKGLIRLDVNREKVKASPPYDPTVTVDGAYDATFQTYYGIKWVAK